MSEEQTNFKITDRRLFNADGTPRESGHREEEPAILDLKPETPPRGAEPQSATATRQMEEEEDEELSQDPASFVNFVNSLAVYVAVALGLMPNPQSGLRSTDLEMAKHWIDVLGMLQQKTRGNLNAQEQHFIEGLLAEMRMHFLSLTSAPPAGARKFTGGDITGGGR
jgi:hypothetical protein